MNEARPLPPNAESGLASPASAEHTRTVRSEVLMAGQREMLIQHGPDTYRLRVTAQGKLILTK
ncbi:MAG: Hemin uptake protein hemP [Pseudomonadota bacterium]|jgi:hemin uptake protein HemP